MKIFKSASVKSFSIGSFSGGGFYLEDQYLGSCECPSCGKWFNLFGQEVLSPDQYNPEGW